MNYWGVFFVGFCVLAIFVGPWLLPDDEADIMKRRRK
jgi:hypothetical protein